MESKDDQFSKLRKELKDWEFQFLQKMNRKPTNQDILKDPIGIHKLK